MKEVNENVGCSVDEVKTETVILMCACCVNIVTQIEMQVMLKSWWSTGVEKQKKREREKAPE